MTSRAGLPAPGDDGLRRAFRDVREADAGDIPDFGELLTGARGRAARRRAGRGIGAAVALTALALFATRATDRDGDSGRLAGQLMASATLWRGPTDFLLETRPVPLWRRALPWMRATPASELTPTQPPAPVPDEPDRG